MTPMIRLTLALCLVSGLTGCGGDFRAADFRPFAFLDRDRGGSDVPPPPSVQEDDGETAEDPAENEAPEVAATPESGELGTTIATLGDPSRPGLWLETPLVTTETTGRIETEAGESLDVTLIPSGGLPGSGSRISLAAMQALGLGLTELVTLAVTAGS